MKERLSDEEFERLCDSTADYGPLSSGRKVIAEARRAREAEEKAERERDLAIAHDRQPYPTAAAYEAVCAAREKYAKSADAAIAERDRLAALVAEKDAASRVRTPATHEGWTLCFQDGYDVNVDDEGCCVSCGADALQLKVPDPRIKIDAQAARLAELEALAEELYRHLAHKDEGSISCLQCATLITFDRVATALARSTR